MMYRNSSSLFTLTIAGIILCTALAPGTSAAHPPQKIEGSWVVSITGGSGTPTLPVWYQALATFSRDGGLIETITDPGIQTGHGSWIRTGNREFTVITLLFQFDTAGQFLGTLKARATLKVNQSGDEFTSDQYLFEFFDPAGNPVTSGEGMAHGSRIEVEPLP
jgi:hypothetical protein